MTTTSLNTPKDYAEHYRKEYGFSVFVLKNEPAQDRKKPAVKWELYQIMRPSRIQHDRWFDVKNPNYNVAAATGDISKIVAFDVDSQTAVERIKEKIPLMSSNLQIALANTMKNRTGSGGEHIIFKIEEPIDISQKVLWSDGHSHSQILLQGNGHYLVMPPSKHPNGEHYEWNGKAPYLITKQELDEFIRLVSPSNTLPAAHLKQDKIIIASGGVPRALAPRSLTTEKMQELLTCIKPYYTPGNRDHIIFYLSGMMRKNGRFPLENARGLIKLLCNASGYKDEDLDKSLTVVDNTYRKPLDELNGKSGLHDLLVLSYERADHNNKGEYSARAEAFSRICQIINGDFLEIEDNEDNDDDHNDGVSVEEHGAWLSQLKTTTKDLKVISTLAKEIMQSNYFKTLEDTKEILWYNNGVYHSGGEDRITILLERLGGYEVTSHVRTEVIEHIKARTMVKRSEFDKEIYLVNCKNCIIDLRSGRTLGHDPERHLFFTQLPVSYRPNEIMSCRKILDFLYNVMHPSDVVLVIEFIGYCLIRNSSLFQKALMCAGPPDSGKSTFLKLLRAFLGEANVSTKTMHQLNENRFATAALFGKLADIFADLSSKRLSDIEMFKVIVAGDEIDAEHKFKNSFTFTPYAKLVFSANLPPLPQESLEEEEAYYKRWFVVSFNLRKTCFFCGKKLERDSNLIDKITTEDELSGLLYLAVKAGQRLLANGRFTYWPSIESTRELYIKKANPVKAWADARCAFSKEYEGDKEKLHADFEAYCIRKKLPSVNLIHLARELKSLYYVNDERIGPRGAQKHVWKGITLRKDLRASGQLGLDEPDELEDS